MVGYDEKTETWFLRARESQRLMLTRPSLQRLVQMYNGIHQGRPLVLVERKELDRLEEAGREQAEQVHELRRNLHRYRASGPLPFLARTLANLLTRRR